ncbi:hypothetical protein RCL1_002816 [Eukaryota sp. TZLM3-RCL]
MPKYDFVRELGSGGFGSAHLVKDSSGNLFCRKEIILSNDQQAKSAEAELRFFDLPDWSPFLVRYHDFFKENNSLFIIMEYADAGSLDSMIKTSVDTKTPLSADFIWKVFLQSLFGIQFLHSHAILHRDIKPGNILLSTNGDTFDCKLCDFGVSTAIDVTLARTQIGTMSYMAPELFQASQESGYGKAADFFSLGIVLFELITGYVPFDSMLEIVSSEVPSIYDDFHDFLDVLHGLLRKNPSTRYGFTQVINTPSVRQQIKKQFQDLSFLDVFQFDYYFLEDKSSFLQAPLQVYNPGDFSKGFCLSRAIVDNSTNSDLFFPLNRPNLIDDDVLADFNQLSQSNDVYATSVLSSTNYYSLFSKEASPNELVKLTMRGVKLRDTRCYHLLGISYITGFGVNLDPDKGFFYIEMAAKHGNPEAMTDVATLYLYGYGTNLNYFKAFDYYSRAGTFESFCRLSLMFEIGASVTPSITKSASCKANALNSVANKTCYLSSVKTAAGRGNPWEMLRLALFYTHGLGVKQSLSEAFQWTFRAAGTGFPLAKVLLGNAYQNGTGTSSSGKKAFPLYLEAVNDGCTVGFFYLAQCYQNGVGTRKSHADALNHYTRGANAGCGRCCLALSKMLTNSNPKLVSLYQKRAVASGCDVVQ